MPNTKRTQTLKSANQTPSRTFEQEVLGRLAALDQKIDEKFEELDERLNQIEQRVLDIDLPTGDGFERETY